MPAKKGVEIGENCPKCGRPLVEQYSRQTGNKFIGCSGWKDKEKPCTYKRTIEGEEILGPVETEHKCPVCGKNMMQMTGRFGVYLRLFGCSRMQDDHEPQRGRQADHSSGRHATQVREVRQPDGLTRIQGEKVPGLQRLSQVPQCKDVDDKGQPIKPVETGSIARNAASRCAFATVFAGRSWRAAVTPSVAMPSRFRRS